MSILLDVYLTGVSTQNDTVLEGFFVIEKKKITRGLRTLNPTFKLCLIQLFHLVVHEIQNSRVFVITIQILFFSPLSCESIK